MNKKVSRIIALVVVLCMMFTTVAFAAPKDKRYEHFNKKYELKAENYELALKALIEKQIVKGYGNGNYGMSGNVKRGDVIVMIIRMLDNYDKKYDISLAEIKSAFNDVYDYEYFAESIAKAKKIGIAKGDGKYFNPNKPITVQEVIWLVERTGEQLGLDFEDDDIEYLEEFFSDRLNKFAKRQEVFLMLNYLIENYEIDDENETQDDLLVEFILEQDEDELFFVTKKFTQAFGKYLEKNDLDDDLDLEYITFDDDYDNPVYVDDDVEEDIEEDQKYYKSGNDYLIKNIKLKRENNINEKIKIPFNAYDDEKDKHEGTIIITVEKNTVFKNITYTMLEDETLQFNKSDFDKTIEKVKFDFPDKKVGALYYGVDKNNISKITDEDGEYSYSRIDRIFFIPNAEFYGKTAEVEYTATTKDKKSVTGSIVINVMEVKSIGEIEEVEMDKDDKVTIKFADKLDSKLPSGVELEDIDFVRFSEPNKGSLWISKARVDSNKEYDDMSKLGEIVYRSTDVEPDDITFYAVDLSELIIYTGTIDIELEDK